ncbi:MAG TPA: insulinase family protein, partial [Pirellulaceae bacterium]
MEHLAFRGANRPLVEQLAEHGASTNGQTGRDYTLYSIDGHIDGFNLALEFVSNIVTAPTMNE